MNKVITIIIDTGFPMLGLNNTSELMMKAF